MKKGTIQKLKRILPVILVVCLFLFPVSARAASPRGLRTGMPAGGRMEKGEVSLPDIRVDKDTEYEKLREAVKTMDEMGLTPDKLLKSFWSFVSSREERKKAGEKLDELRERVRKLIGGSSEKESGGKSEAEREKAESDPAEKSGKEPEKAESGPAEKVGKELEKAENDLAEKVGKELDQTVDTAAEKAKESIKEKASQEIEEAADKLFGETAGE